MEPPWFTWKPPGDNPGTSGNDIKPPTMHGPLRNPGNHLFKLHSTHWPKFGPIMRLSQRPNIVYCTLPQLLVFGSCYCFFFNLSSPSTLHLFDSNCVNECIRGMYKKINFYVRMDGSTILVK